MQLATTTRRKQVRDETFKLLTENGLEGWKVRFNPRMTRALGRCIPSQKTIEYQPRYMQQNGWEQVNTTIKHEVAHAIAGGRHGHDAYWAAIARKLGLENPSAINRTANLTKKFTGTCDGCNQKWERDRRVMGAACPPCRRLHIAGDTSKRYTIRWTRNA